MKVALPSTSDLSLDELEKAGVRVKKASLGVSGKNKEKLRQEDKPLYGCTYQSMTLHDKMS